MSLYLGTSAGSKILHITNGTNTTTIDGAKITTGSINANRLGANIGEMGILYNKGGNSDTYTMMINFNTGEIHIK